MTATKQDDDRHIYDAVPRGVWFFAVAATLVLFASLGAWTSSRLQTRYVETLQEIHDEKVEEAWAEIEARVEKIEEETR